MKKYEGECIKNMELFEFYVSCIKLKQKNELNSLFPNMFDWIYKTRKLMNRNTQTATLIIYV